MIRRIGITLCIFLTTCALLYGTARGIRYSISTLVPQPTPLPEQAATNIQPVMVQEKHITENTTTPLCTSERTTTSVLTPKTRENSFLYIAHTLGLTPEGASGTNTKEAFEHSYQKGFRLFETDFLRTKDGHILVAHDKHEPFWGLSTLFEDTLYAEIQGATYNDIYTPLDIEALLKLLVVYPDTYIILDIKFDSPEMYDEMLADIILEASLVLGEEATYRRLIPQIYVPEDILRNKHLCNFSDIIFTQYRNTMPWSDVLTFLREYPRVTAIAAQYPHRFRPSYLEDLLMLDRGLYLHPITDEAVMVELTQQSIGVFTTVSTTISY